MMKPRTVHFFILSVICLVPALAGAFLAAKGQSAHSELGGIDVVIGLALLAGSALYVGVSSLLAWKFGTTPLRVFAVHGGIFFVLFVFFGGPRLYFLVHR